MDEQILFDRLHRALDVESRPGAYERLRIALTKTPVQPQRWTALAMTWPKMGVRLAAIMTVVVLAIAAGAAFLATHRVADRVSPADSNQAIAAYQKLVGDDYALVTTAAAGWTCNNGSQFAACETDGSNILPFSQRLLDDLNRHQAPARFAVADTQLRRHLAAQNSRVEALLIASRAHDAARADRELKAIQGGTGAQWGPTMVSSILSSHQGTAATYVESVRYEKQGLDGCSACLDLAGPNQYDCTGNQATTCRDLVDSAAGRIARFQTALVALSAPSSMTPRDNGLQLDLAKADTALITMADALATGDQAAFNAGRNSFHQAVAAVNSDAAGIFNGK